MDEKTTLSVSKKNHGRIMDRKDRTNTSADKVLDYVLDWADERDEL